MTVHKPVLVEEVLELLDPKKNQNFIDGTIGGGGHAEEILKLTGPDGKLLGLDWDKDAIKRTKKKLAKYKDRLILVNDSYTNVKQAIYEEKFNSFDGILLDLGLSSDQLEVSGRGFSFQNTEPLDMRFSTDSELTAEFIVNNWSGDEIKQMLFDNAEEKFAYRISNAIVEHRKEEEIKTTTDLVNIVARVVPKNRRKNINPATKTFQALRIAVNDEFGNIRSALKDMIELMKPGAKLAVITFHSLEDRIVKKYFKQESLECLCPRELPVCRCNHKKQIKLITRKAVAASEEEIKENKRSRSAKLRVVEKL